MDSRRFAKTANHAASKHLLIGVLVIALLIATVVVFAVANIPKEVTILDGTTSLKVTTNEKDPQKIITQNGFSLGKYDVLDSSQFAKQNAVLIIKREMTLEFCESGGESWKLTLPARTVNDVLEYLNITLGEADVVEPSGFEIVKQGDVITLFKAGKAALEADGVRTQVLTNNKTVSQILAENSILLGKDDEVSPSLDTIVNNGDTIVVTRVEIKKEVKKAAIEYKTVEKEEHTLAAGTEKVVSEGANGEKEITYSVRYENGKAVKKTIVGEKVLKKAKDRVVKVGTASAAKKKKAAGGTATVDETKLKYTAKYTGIASAYYEPAGNLTASGMTVGYGRIGVNPKIIPYGTKLYVTGYGYCVAADTGWGTVGMGRIADLYFGSEAECEAWGLRTVTMYVLA